MPTRIGRDEALRRVAAGSPAGCVPCALVEEPAPLAGSPHAVARLTRYPVRWGHALVVFRRHVTSIGELEPEEWADAAELARKVACAIELALEPSRVYVAALGTDLPDLPMTFPHLHFHVLGVPEVGARPREVLTWQNGIYEASDAEWAGLRTSLGAALAEL